MMKLGVRAHDFGKAEPDTLASAIYGAGFEAVQLAIPKAIAGIDSMADVTGDVLDRVGEAFRIRNVEISVLGCYIEPSLPDKEVRLAQVETFRRGLEAAKYLGVSLVGTETTRFDPDPANEPNREQAYQALLDSVRRMTEHAERLGVQIAIEPVADHTLHSAELAKRLLEEVDSDCVRIIFDPVNMILERTAVRQREIYRQFLDILGDRLCAVHIKDIVFEAGEKVWRNLGEGVVYYDDIVTWLHANLPNIPLLREHVKPQSAQIDIEAMRRLARR